MTKWAPNMPERSGMVNFGGVITVQLFNWTLFQWLFGVFPFFNITVGVRGDYWLLVIDTTSISLAFYHRECTKYLFQLYTTNMFPQSTIVFTSAITKLTKNIIRLQMIKLIMVVEIFEQFAAVFTQFPPKCTLLTWFLIALVVLHLLSHN